VSDLVFEITDTDLQGVAVTLRRLERFWMRVGDILEASGHLGDLSCCRWPRAATMSRYRAVNRW
jgi:hypothetical protein